MRIGPLAALCLALMLAACGGQPKVDYRQGEFRAHGWRGPEPAGGWASVFPVSNGGPENPAMLGEYRRAGSTVIFKPRFKPQGLVTAVFHPPAGAEQTLQIAFRGSPDTPQVTGISPDSPVVPENLLKLYVEFSAPMARGEAWRHLAIIDQAGAVVPDPFVEIDQELWDPSGRRLTVLFDPGRIKREVKPNQDVGAPLIPGRGYRLIVRQGWHSAAGGTLAADTEKAFTVETAERRPIVLADWRIVAPGAGSKEPLTVDFPRPMDSALAADSLHVQAGGETVAGTVTLADHARRWSFTPKAAWRAGAYTLLVETRLEDLAGNRIGRAFDVDMVAAPQARISKASESLSFAVK